jgi:hypothetical protein
MRHAPWAMADSRTAPLQHERGRPARLSPTIKSDQIVLFSRRALLEAAACPQLQNPFEGFPVKIEFLRRPSTISLPKRVFGAPLPMLCFYCQVLPTFTCNWMRSHLRDPARSLCCFHVPGRRCIRVGRRLLWAGLVVAAAAVARYRAISNEFPGLQNGRGVPMPRALRLATPNSQKGVRHRRGCCTPVGVGGKTIRDGFLHLRMPKASLIGCGPSGMVFALANGFCIREWGGVGGFANGVALCERIWVAPNRRKVAFPRPVTD